MTLDELSFEALAPDQLRDIITKMAPLKIPPWRRWRGADIKSVSWPIMILGMMAVMYFGYLQGVIENLERAHEIICGGPLNFARQTDPMEIVHIEELVT